MAQHLFYNRKIQHGISRVTLYQLQVLLVLVLSITNLAYNTISTNKPNLGLYSITGNDSNYRLKTGGAY